MNIQQLKAKIAALQDATMDENKNFRTAYDEGKFDALTAVDNLLDSLQEESVSVWHNMDEVPIKGEVIVVQTKDTFYGLSVQKGGTTYKNKNKDRYIKWAYASDLLNLSNVERIGKEWKEEPVSEDLEEAANDYAHELLHDDVFETFIAGAQWQKEHLWKPADGDDLPDIDREVIVLYQRYPLENNEYAVGFAHRQPEFWDLKNIHTGEITRFEPERYDKGGWNIPDVKFWLDCELPKMEE